MHERPVRAVFVVVPDVDPQDPLEVATANDQQPVQALGADRRHPALGVRVRPGRLHRRQDHLATVRAEPVVEAAGERRVPIVQHQAGPSALLAQHQQQVAGLLGDPRPSGLAVTPVRCTRRVSSSMRNSTFSRRSKTVSTAK